MGPERRLELRKRNCKEERPPSSAGMGPDRALEERSSRRSEERRPRDGGMAPEMLAEERLSSCSDVREESCGGSAVRLRKMLGRAREMTLPCGEQVTPSHEQGVEREASHEGSGAAAGEEEAKRESRTVPSGERAEMARGRRKISTARRRRTAVLLLFWIRSCSIRELRGIWRRRRGIDGHRTSPRTALLRRGGSTEE